MKNHGFEEKKIPQNFTVGKIYFLKGVQIDRTRKYRIVYFFYKFSSFSTLKNFMGIVGMRK